MTRKEYLSSLKVGDKITRLMAGIPIPLTIWKIENGVIFTENNIITKEAGWRFDAETGAEIDEDLGWDGKTVTGSYIQIPDTPTGVKVEELSDIVVGKAKYLAKKLGKSVDEFLDEAKTLFKDE